MIDLIYIDPPFDSKADYKKKIRLEGDDVIGDESSFEEKQYTDIWTNDEYLQFMYERITLLRELLSRQGTCVIHVDSSKMHHLRCILDEIFGENNFRSEVVWYYENKLGTGGSTLDSRHDTLLVYGKGSSHTFNKIALPVKNVKPQPVTQKIDGKRVWLKDGRATIFIRKAHLNARLAMCGRSRLSILLPVSERVIQLRSQKLSWRR